MMGMLLAWACTLEQPTDLPVMVAPVEAFAELVQPVLEARCSTPGCHGTADRPLSVYAPLQRRMDPERLFIDEPLFDEEIAANAWRATAFLQGLESDEDSLLVRKPLDPRSGGVEHEGGVQFLDLSTGEVEALLEWIALREEAP